VILFSPPLFLASFIIFTILFVLTWLSLSKIKDDE
jgi:hypothetical protein